MKKIGILIPEFPGQTHAFFVRERIELEKLGMETRLFSTRKPKSGIASHDWADVAEQETTYLFPISLIDTLFAISTVILAGPGNWARCIKTIVQASDASIKEKFKLAAIIIVGGHFKRLSEQQSISEMHIHSCANSANIAMFAELLGGPKYSLTLHGPLSDYGQNQEAKWRHAEFAIVITKELFAEVRNNLNKTQLPQIYLAPMGVNVEVFKRQSQYNHPVLDSTIKLVSCGRLNYVKAHDDLIRAVKGLIDNGVDTELTICGATDTYSEQSGYLEELYRLCSESGLESKVSFLGSISEERVKEELENAHIFCLASLKEPLGVAIMEAMAMNMPVVVASSPGVTELVEDGIDGILVDPRSPEQFVSAILELVGRPDLNSKISENARHKIVEHFHSGVSAKTIFDGYIGVCEDSRDSQSS